MDKNDLFTNDTDDNENKPEEKWSVADVTEKITQKKVVTGYVILFVVLWFSMFFYVAFSIPGGVTFTKVFVFIVALIVFAIAIPGQFAKAEIARKLAEKANEYVMADEKKRKEDQNH